MQQPFAWHTAQDALVALCGSVVQVMRKRTNKMPAEETDQYIRFLTWTFEQTIKAAQARGADRWIALLDMNGCACLL